MPVSVLRRAIRRVLLRCSPQLHDNNDQKGQVAEMSRRRANWFGGLAVVAGMFAYFGWAAWHGVRAANETALRGHSFSLHKAIENFESAHGVRPRSQFEQTSHRHS